MQMKRRKAKLKFFAAGLFILAVLTPSGAEDNRIELTRTERDWLYEHPVIRVVQDPGWPPIEFVDADGKSTGMSNDYLSLIEERLGITFTHIEGLSWQQAYEKLKNFEIDMTTSVTVTRERLNFWIFTEPYMEMPISIITRADVTYISTMNELDHKKVAIVEGYAVADWIPGDYPEIELVTAASAIEALEMLNNKEVFAYVDNMLIAGYYMAQKKFFNLKVAGETPYSNNQSMAVRKDWPVLAGILQKALDSISEQEREQIYYKWVPIKYEYGFNYSLFWKIAVGFAVLLLLMIIWIQKLTLEIQKRKAAEYMLRFHLDETPIGVIQWNVDFTVSDWNPAAERIFGYKKEDVIGKTGSFIAPERLRDKQRQRWERLLKGEKIVEDIAHVSENNITKDGKVITCEWGSTPITSADGTVIGVVSLFRDITSIVEAQKQIRTSLSEKEILLSELYHRTKNNMQMIAAFLRLQADLLQSEDVELIVQSVNSKIQTMSLVHEKLCESKDLSRINFREYTEDLVSLLPGLQTAGQKDIAITCKVEDIYLSIDSAIPLGLVINEIVTNAFKHAFIGKTKGHLLIRLYLEKESIIVLEISDDGVGFSAEADENLQGFGIRTITTIIEKQMRGKIELSSEHGTSYRITVNISSGTGIY